MAQLTRKLMKLFGSTSGPQELGVFGSMAAGSPAYSTDPDSIQSLSNYLTGWYGAVIGGYSPAIQDMNALFYLYAYQLCYVFQAGVPEWNNATEYYIGSFVSDGAGNLFTSIQNTNVGHAVTDTAWWRKVNHARTETFLGDASWVAPTGVTKVKVSVYANLFSQIAACQGSVNGINLSGNAYAWGENSNGQGGIGSTVPVSSPVSVVGVRSWRQVAFGGVNSMLLDAAGNAWGSGANSVGGIGNGTSVATSVPVQTIGGLKFKNIAAGGGHTAAVTSSGVAYAWGANNLGQIGDNTTVVKSSPVLVSGSRVWREVTCSANSTFGIDSSGNAYAWGGNANGQLGIGSITPVSSPTLVVGGVVWNSLSGSKSSNQSATLGLSQANTAYAWGDNTYGQLGDLSVIAKSSPTLVSGNKTWRVISSGGTTSIGIDTNGDAWTWGNNAQGALGTGASTPAAVSSPVMVVGGYKWVYVVASSNLTGSASTCFGITTTGDLYAWGSNTNGQLGRGNVTSTSSPVLVLGSQKWSSATEALVNSKFYDVVPTLSYPVTVNGALTMFNSDVLYQDPYGGGVIPTKVILEY